MQLYFSQIALKIPAGSETTSLKPERSTLLPAADALPVDAAKLSIVATTRPTIFFIFIVLIPPCWFGYVLLRSSLDDLMVASGFGLNPELAEQLSSDLGKDGSTKRSGMLDVDGDLQGEFSFA